MEKQEEVRALLRNYLDADLERMIFSGPRSRDGFLRMTVRPVAIRGTLFFQVEEFTEKQAFQKNLAAPEAAEYVLSQLDRLYRNGEIFSRRASAHLLIGKRGTVTLKEKKKIAAPADGAHGGVSCAAPASPFVLSHNRAKRYLFPEGTPVPFLVELGVMTKEGKVVRARYDKFRQINRFLEYVEDVLPALSPDRVNTIIDFGCGKSYLTFAMYYYLKEMKGYPVHIVGLDLKQDVIELCSRLSRQFGFSDLEFSCGDIAGYEGVRQADMVVTLHACDTATDYALHKAVRWGARVILSVPCCQHELNGQMENELLAPILKYGILKERMAALITDGIRAQFLELAGYHSQILEFIDMEHTPKNLMIRAVRREAGAREKKNNREKQALKELLDGLQVRPTLLELLEKDGLISFTAG